MYQFAGTIIKKARKEMNMSQRELIRKLGADAVSPRTLRRIETGTGSVKKKTIDLVLGFFDIQLPYTLIDETEKDIMSNVLSSTEPIHDCLKLINKEITDYRSLFCTNSHDYEGHRFHIESLVSFLAYYPLMDKALLNDSLSRIGGDFTNFGYVLKLLENLYSNIPNSKEKEIADKMVKQSSDMTLEECKQYQSLLENNAKISKYIIYLIDMIHEKREMI